MANGKKVLIVDDDPFILDMYVLKFKDDGFNVEVAMDGKKAFEEAQAKQPDIILLDVIMPLMDGFEVLQKIKNDPSLKDTPVIMLTNLGQKEDMEKGMTLGAADYVIKAHFTPSEVVQKVKQVLKI
jgi:DNA-binding response OmpR family regulator